MNSGLGDEHSAVMPAHHRQQTEIRTFLADYRLVAGLTQQEMAWAIGISPASYIRLERGQNRNPPLGWLINAAFVLDVALEDLFEDRLSEWHPLGGRREPPSAEWYQRPKVIERAERMNVQRDHGKYDDRP